MAGQKRTRTGELKPANKHPSQATSTPTPTTTTPLCAQAPTTTTTATSNPPPRKAPPKPTPKTKRTPLPPGAKISKRPLLHPALPSPYASASAPKTLYITASTPFIPACKRIRSLLSQVQKRSAQAAAAGEGGKRRGKGQRRGGLEANGRLGGGEVEAGIVAAVGSAGVKARGGRAGGEEIYLKATGRAIPRALELGVQFQAEGEWGVRVEMGSVRAVDDVEIGDGDGDGEGENGSAGEEVPETRIRTLSTVTVCIGLV